ncbi:hypothetical protein AN476_20950 [Phaeobacter sp. 11ANDIMAR09]|nr:hypothetical protein AN476_20950 [Phaeobacter sp. 11ANDIMAR09]
MIQNLCERTLAACAASVKLDSKPPLRAKTAFDSLNVRFREVEARFVRVQQDELTSLRTSHFGLTAVIDAKQVGGRIVRRANLEHD